MRNVFLILFPLVAGLFLVTGCGTDIVGVSLDAPSAEPVVRTKEIPQVISLYGPRLCTGTIISERVVLTASHCLKAENILLSHQNRKVVAARFVTLGPGATQDSSDIGLVYFKDSLLKGTGMKPLALADNVNPGEVITMIGYGCNQRAMGTHKLFQIRDYLEVLWSRPYAPPKPRIQGPRNRAESCNGDSGGPALVKRNDVYEVVGVLHGLLSEGPEKTMTVFSDVSRGKNREFLTRNLAGN